VLYFLDMLRNHFVVNSNPLSRKSW